MTRRHLRTAGSDTPGGRGGQRLVRAVREFAIVPLLVVLAFLVLAVVSILADQSHALGVDRLRSALHQLIGKEAATSALQAVATGLVTVTSITFSVLLLAVQQTATSLSPVVFDQFVRRRANQLLLGFFVGLTLYAYVVMTAVPGDTSPIIGAAVATLLTAVALMGLLVLVYTTIDQMRPVNVLRQIHDRTLRAREREIDLIRRTRRQEASPHPVTATYRSTTTGYVTRIDLTRLAAALRRIPSAEIRLQVALGEHLAYGDIVATIRDDDMRRAESLADEVRGAMVIGAAPDLDNDATTGIDQLGNIAWTSGSTAKQNPEVARQALHAVQDIAARWITGAQPGTDDEPPLAIVYPDDDLDRLLDVLYSLLVAAHESHQHMAAARVLEAYRALLCQAGPEATRRLRADLSVAEPLLDALPPSPMLGRARSRIRDLTADGRNSTDDHPERAGQRGDHGRAG
ncbi:MAG: DUF2254 family protein [Micromonospora sp.]